MAVVDLTDIRIRGYLPVPINQARAQKPAYGSAFLLDRLGGRWAFQFATPLMPAEPDCRQLLARFDDAERLGGLFAIPQSRFPIGAPGSPTVATATASGREVPVTGGTPSYAFRAGQWISLLVGGQYYADRIAEQAILDASGEGTLRLRNLIRVALPEGTTVEAGAPKIEGIVEVTARPAIDPRHRVAIEWTVTEAR